MQLDEAKKYLNSKGYYLTEYLSHDFWLTEPYDAEDGPDADDIIERVIDYFKVPDEEEVNKILSEKYPNIFVNFKEDSENYDSEIIDNYSVKFNYKVFLTIKSDGDDDYDNDICEEMLKIAFDKLKSDVDYWECIDSYPADENDDNNNIVYEYNVYYDTISNEPEPPDPDPDDYDEPDYGDWY